MKTKSNEKPRSVVYSFSGRWESALRTGCVQVFFRKRRPVKLPDRVYLYVGVPIKMIIGYAQVQKIEPIGLKGALAVQEKGAITPSELSSYIGHSGSVHAIWIDKPVIFPDGFDLKYLSENFQFNPPQSFSNLDPNVEKTLLGYKK